MKKLGSEKGHDLKSRTVTELVLWVWMLQRFNRARVFDLWI